MEKLFDNYKSTSRRLFLSALLLALVLSGIVCPASCAQQFLLRSRSVIEGPSRAVEAFEEGFVLGTGGGIAIFRVDSPRREPAFLPLAGEPKDLCTSGRTLYVAASSGGLITVDLSDPEHPSIKNRFEIERAAMCSPGDRMLFLADEKSHLHVFMLDNPLEPEYRTSRVFDLPLISIASQKSIVAVAHAKAIEILAADSSGKLTDISRVVPDEKIKQISIIESVLFVLTENGKVMGWDIETPETPRELARPLAKSIINMENRPKSLFLLGKRKTLIYLAIKRHREDRNTKLEISRGAVWKFGKRWLSFQKLFVNSGDPGYEPERFDIAGKHVGIISPLGGIELYEMRGKGLKLISSFSTRGVALAVVVSDDLVALANGADGVRIGNLFADGSVEWISHLQTQEARDVRIFGKNLYIADGTHGIKIADLSDPNKPAIIGSHPSPYYQSALTIRADRAYCAGGMFGAEILDISNPPRPALVWRKRFSEVRGIDADERYCYIADGYEGLRIFSLSTTRPVLVSTLDTPGWNCDIIVEGELAYLADGHRGIAIADISKREDPRTIAYASTESIARRLFLFEKTLFVAGSQAGVLAFDISDPKRPQHIASYKTVGDARGVFADERFVYVASAEGGLYILSLDHREQRSNHGR